eukprot:scaffold1169_cov120-Cylindrotheca_fusiformis.AAC.18
MSFKRTLVEVPRANYATKETSPQMHQIYTAQTTWLLDDVPPAERQNSAFLLKKFAFLELVNDDLCSLELTYYDPCTGEGNMEQKNNRSVSRPPKCSY